MPDDRGSFLESLVDDLVAEEDDLAALLAGLGDGDWSRSTPAEGWTVLDQVAHLAESEELAALALGDPDGFAARLAVLLDDLDAVLAAMQTAGSAASPAVTLARWDVARRATVAGLRAVEPTARIAWVTGPMSSASFATARLMETWAHGHDVADALGVEPRPTARLHHVAHLGVATREFSFRNRGVDPPASPVSVTLTAPDGQEWQWGLPDAPERVRGSALGFCLVVTQRRHVDDTDLVADGDGATQWLALAQAFAGPPTDGPPPGS